MNLRDYLHKLSACKEAREWAAQYDTLDEAWSACPKGDWMLWLWGRYCGESFDDRRRPLVLATIECARLALPFFERKRPNDRRPREALDIAERWGRGGAVTQQEIEDAADDARDAAYAAYAAASAAASASAANASAYAAYAAAYASYADDASTAARASAAAAYAAFVSADAASSDAAASRASLLAQCADIVRRHMPTQTFLNDERRA
jgi:hypothetical protein